MEFVFDTVYNQKAVATMARTLRKTIRKRKSRRSHILGGIIIVFALLLTLPFGNEVYSIDFNTIITWIAALVILIVLVCEDKINGYIARKRMLPGTERAISTFNESGYSSTSNMGKTEWLLSNINTK